MLKPILIAVPLIWSAFVCELAFPRICPPGALLFPLAGGLVLWNRGPSGLLAGGFLLLTDLVVRPVQLPLSAVCFPLFAAAGLMSAPRQQGASRPRWSIPLPLRLPLVTGALILLRLVSDIPWRTVLTPLAVLPQLQPDPVLLRRSLIVAVPLSAMITLIVRLAEEFGFRRSSVQF